MQKTSDRGLSLGLLRGKLSLPRTTPPTSNKALSHKLVSLKALESRRKQAKDDTVTLCDSRSNENSSATHLHAAETNSDSLQS